MKKCPVCSREYRDVVSLCPFDGANLTLIAVSETPSNVGRPPARETVSLNKSPDLRNRDDEETLVRNEPSVIPPLPAGQEYRPNAANAASLPRFGESPYDPVPSEQSPEPDYNAKTPPVVAPLGPGRAPARPVKESNPWRIATFALAGLIVIFLGAWFMFGGAKSGSSNNSNDPMAVDPNSANVNQAPPVTGMESTFPPPGGDPNNLNLNANTPPAPAPLPGQGAGPNSGPMSPFPSNPPPSIRGGLNENSVFPPAVTNNNAPINPPSLGNTPLPTPKTTPRPNVVPSPGVTVSPRPAASPSVPAPSPKPSASVAPAPSPKPSVAPKPSPSNTVEPF